MNGSYFFELNTTRIDIKVREYNIDKLMSNKSPFVHIIDNKIKELENTFKLIYIRKCNFLLYNFETNIEIIFYNHIIKSIYIYDEDYYNNISKEFLNTYIAIEFLIKKHINENHNIEKSDMLTSRIPTIHYTFETDEHIRKKYNNYKLSKKNLIK